MNNIKELIENYNEGNTYILDTFLELRKKREELKLLLDLINDFESENINEIELAIIENHKEYSGAKFEARNGRKIFNFKNITEVTELENKLKATKKKYQIAFEAKQKGNSMIDEDTGEFLQVPTMSQGKSSIIVKF